MLGSDKMDEVKYKNYLKNDIMTNESSEQLLSLLDSFSINQIILELLKNNNIDFSEAVRLQKIFNILKKYESIEIVKLHEQQYYKRFNCISDREKIVLELKYLKTKLLKMNSRNKNMDIHIVDSLLIIQKLEEQLQNPPLDESTLQIIKETIILLELDFNIEIKFLIEAHEYLKNKIYELQG